MKIETDKVVAVILGVMLAIGFILFQLPHPPRPRTPPAVRPATKAMVTRSASVVVDVYADAVGTIRSRRQTQIAARVLAEVKEIRRHPGDAVKTGETLIVLDNLDLKARVDQAEANLRAQEEGLREARTEFDRKAKLLEKRVVTQQEYDDARLHLATVEARRDAAQKTVEESRIQLGYAAIAAPFDGLIYEKNVDPGDIATPGKPLLGLYDPSQLRLEAVVDESLLWKIALNDPLRIGIDALGEPLQGRVSETVPAIDPATRTGTVKVDLPANVAAKPGMFGRARIPVSRREIVAVPALSIVRRGQIEIVFTTTDRRTARMRIVRTGPPLENDPSRVEILAGLHAGEPIVISNAHDLNDGDLLDITVESGNGER